MRQAYDYWQDQPGNYHQRDALRNHARKPILPQERKTSVPSRFIQEILSFLKLLSVDDVSRSPDQSRIRKCPENRDSQRVPLLPSPLLYGPFLISPRRNQNATPRISTPKQPCPDIKSEITQNRSALAPELPQAPLRGEVPPRFSPLSNPLFPSLSLERNKRKIVKNIENSQQVYPQVGFEYFYS